MLYLWEQTILIIRGLEANFIKRLSRISHIVLRPTLRIGQRCLLTFAALLVSSAFAPAAIAARPTGENCTLTSPPSEAGEETNHGQVLRIYPRAKDIGPAYTGCQALFALQAKKWLIVSLTEIVNGDPVRVWSEDAQSVLACRYNSGKVVAGDPEKCPMARFLLLKSMAPGCVKRIQESVAKQGLGTPRPKQCEYQ